MSHPLATVRDITGTAMRLGMFESAVDIKVEPETITLSVNRARYRETTRRYYVTHRGMSLVIFRLMEGQWVQQAEPFTVWWSTDEVHARF